MRIMGAVSLVTVSCLIPIVLLEVYKLYGLELSCDQLELTIALIICNVFCFFLLYVFILAMMKNRKDTKC